MIRVTEYCLFMHTLCYKSRVFSSLLFWRVSNLISFIFLRLKFQGKAWWNWPIKISHECVFPTASNHAHTHRRKKTYILTFSVYVCVFFFRVLRFGIGRQNHCVKFFKDRFSGVNIFQSKNEIRLENKRLKAYYASPESNCLFINWMDFLLVALRRLWPDTDVCFATSFRNIRQYSPVCVIEIICETSVLKSYCSI